MNDRLNDRPVVYTTGIGRVCPSCGKPVQGVAQVDPHPRPIFAEIFLFIRLADPPFFDLGNGPFIRRDVFRRGYPAPIDLASLEFLAGVTVHPACRRIGFDNETGF